MTEKWRGRTCGECAWWLVYGRKPFMFGKCRRSGLWHQVNNGNVFCDDPACPAFVNKTEEKEEGDD